MSYFDWNMLFLIVGIYLAATCVEYIVLGYFARRIYIKYINKLNKMPLFKEDECVLEGVGNACQTCGKHVSVPVSE